MNSSSPATRHPSLVFLLGFMGSGKSTVGYALAEALHYDFSDTDLLIEQQYGRTIAEIFSEKGEELFRRDEQKIIHGLLGRGKLVVACGGGLPCFFDNMEQMTTHGTTVYLKATPEWLAQRLEAQWPHRPLLQGKTGDELKQHITQMLAHRAPYYNRASMIVDAAQDDVLHDLLAWLDVLDA